MHIKDFSLSFKILASFVAAMLLTFGYIAYSIVVSVKDSTYASEREKAIIILDSVAGEIGMDLYLGLEAQGIQKAKELLAYSDVMSVTLKSASGKVIGQFGAIKADKNAIKDSIKVVKNIKDSVSGRDMAVLELYYSNRNYLRIINNFEQLVVRFFAIAALIFAVTLFFIRHLLAPLSKIAEQMRGYIPGKKIELDYKDRKDEIGSIISSFKAMQENIDNFLEEIMVKDGELMRQSKMKALMDMINAVAHNWRQPLNAIGIMLQDLELAHRYGELDEEYLKNSIAKSMELLNQMSKTIDDFRLFFVSNGKEEEIDVEVIAREVIKAFEEPLASRGISIYIEGEPFTIMGQKELLRDVFASLILNAKDAIVEKMQKNPNHKGLIVIKMDAEHRRLECIDNGGGMSEETLERAFEPYFTTKEQGKGVGLGLFMSRIAISNMNGELKLFNSGEGLRAVILFS